MPSIFATNLVFARYQGRIQFRDKIMGGIPKDPKIIEGWLRSKTGVTSEEEIKQMVLRTLEESGAEVRPDMTFEELEAAASKIAGVKNTNGFKVTEPGPGGKLYIESRYIKACLRECVNIEYAGERMGPTRKGAKAFFAERAFVNPDKIVLNHIGGAGKVVPIGPQPDGVDLFIGHVTGPKGPQSTLTYHEYVINPVIDFEVMVSHDCVGADDWAAIWVNAQEIALGALRSQGFGRFDVLAWKCIEPARRKRVQINGYKIEAVDDDAPDGVVAQAEAVAAAV